MGAHGRYGLALVLAMAACGEPASKRPQPPSSKAVTAAAIGAMVAGSIADGDIDDQNEGSLSQPAETLEAPRGSRRPAERPVVPASVLDGLDRPPAPAAPPAPTADAGVD